MWVGALVGGCKGEDVVLVTMHVKEKSGKVEKIFRDERVEKIEGEGQTPKMFL